MKKQLIKLDKYEQQIILACKGWSEYSKKEDRLKAVKIVLSQYYELNEDDLMPYAMYDCLLHLFSKVYNGNVNQLIRFMLGMFQEKWTGKHVQEITKIHIVQNLISELSNIPVLNESGEKLFELEPGYGILNKGLED